MPRKYKKKTEKQKLEEKLDKLIQQKCTENSNRCFGCNMIKPLSGHHHIPKSRSKKLRWDIDNLVPLCAGCHMQHHNASDPRISLNYRNRMGKERGITGEEWDTMLEKRRNESTKFDSSVKNLNNIYLELCKTTLTSISYKSEEEDQLHNL